jgi:peptidoglycan hydrolase-like amidase
MVNDLLVRAGTTFSVILKNGECEVQNRGVSFTSGPQIRFRTLKPGTLTVAGIKGFTRGYRGALECRVVNGALALINELPLEDYMLGLAEEPDTEPYEKKRAFAIAARTYAAFYMQSSQRKFPGLPYDGSDDPAVFQSYYGADFEARNPEWVRAVRSTANEVLYYKNAIIKPPYFSSDDGKTRTPAQAGWNNFPNAELFSSKEDPWCSGMTLRGHGVGMSGCGALGQAKEGRSAEQILQYYYPGVRIGER